jgi:hypothetical protein
MTSTTYLSLGSDYVYVNSNQQIVLTSGSVNINGIANINTATTNATNIGNASAVTTLYGSSIALNGPSSVSSTTDATSDTTGALTVAGGISCQKSANIGVNLTLG